MDFKRTITNKIKQDMFQGRVIVIHGPRRVGKTTLIKSLYKEYKQKHNALFFNCDNLSVQEAFNTKEASKLKQYLQNSSLVFLDEAQMIKDIGINLKILVDTYPEIQVIATGSSSFEVANKLQEPLTGRAWNYFLAPLSIEEISKHYNKFDIEGLLDSVLKYGLYPEIFTSNTSEKKRKLDEVAVNYLYKDILMFEGIKKSDFLLKLLKLLAFQVGSEVSFNEIANTLEVSKTLVAKYIDLLEKTFVIFSLRPLSRNLRNELNKKRKIYFWDTGIRNALISNFNDLNIRPDKGHLWESFCISERKKYLSNNQILNNSYFWRTYEGQEIDYIEETDGQMNGFEFKWKEKKQFKPPKIFLTTYANSTVREINRSNYWDFVTNNTSQSL
jgi:uncharacterized protein